MGIEQSRAPHVKAKLSIVIPTHKRPETLRRCLEHIARQTIAGALEVIVVSDGHDDATAQLCDENHFPFSTFHFQFFEIPKSQQGVARNRGVDRAGAPLVLFIGDDILLAPDACETHLEVHASRASRAPDSGNTHPKSEVRCPGCAVLGFTTWDPAVGVTPVMRWLEGTGWQFGYPMIRKYAHAPISADLQHRFTYASHVSLPTEIARKIRFREDVTLYGWEDIEWGARLRDAGARLLYEPHAKALHHHRVTLGDSLKRMETLGRSLAHVEQLHPALGRMPRGGKLLAYRLLSLLPTLRGRHAAAFLKGMECSPHRSACAEGRRAYNDH